MSIFRKKDLSPQQAARDNFIKHSITEALGKALKELQRENVETEEPIYSEDSANAVCNVIEAAFLHGLKPAFSTKISSYFIGVDADKSSQPSFWQLLVKCTHKDVISQLNHLAQVTTEIGMCRAWIRLAINDGVLESYFNAILAESKIIRTYYNPNAYLRDSEQPGILMRYMQGLHNFVFRLSYNSSMLNVWTATPLILAGIEELQLIPEATVMGRCEAATEPEYDEKGRPRQISVRRGSRHQTTASGKRVIPVAGSEDELSPLTPPNTPYDASMLTRSDIDAIRQLGMRDTKGSSLSSTPTSQISCPDPTDSRIRRESLQPCGLESVDISYPSHTTSSSTNTDSDLVQVPCRPQSGQNIRDVFPDLSVRPKQFKNNNQKATSRRKNSPNNLGQDLLDNRSVSSNGSLNHLLSDAMLPNVPSPATSEKCLSLPSSHPSKYSNNNESTHSDTAMAASVIHIPENENSNDVFTENTVSKKSSTLLNAKAEADVPSRTNSMPIFNRERRKSKPLEPVLSDVKPVSTFVEVTEDIPQYGINENEELSIYSMRAPPPPQGNNLGQKEGWSSSPQDEAKKIALMERRLQIEKEILENTSSIPEVQISGEAGGARPRTISDAIAIGGNEQATESFNSIVLDYGRSASPPNLMTMSQVLDQIPKDQSDKSDNQSFYSKKSGSAEDELTPDDFGSDYEVIPDNQHLATIIGDFTTEKGLDQQNYQCRNCSRSIGMIFGNPRLCHYDSCYYCYECHENQEFYIPARVVHNWDFQKYKVSNVNLLFLKQSEDEALLNVQQINPRIYEHVPEMEEIREFRQQLQYLKAYLFTCKQSVADDMRRQVWPKEYLYDDIHLYSLQDLIRVQTGVLNQTLRKVIKSATKHVYSCGLCCQKGFFCELCDSSKVIYPFEMETTAKCKKCNSVYHKGCWSDLKTCVKCERRSRRKSSVGGQDSKDSDEDYSMQPQTDIDVTVLED